MTAEMYTITDLAREFGITTRTIRYYEDHALIAPRREGQRRIYGSRDRVRLKLIMQGKRLGFSLGEIREMIEMYDADRSERAQLRLVIDKIAERRAVLAQQQQDIAAILQELAELEARCTALLCEKEAVAQPAARGRR